MPSSRSALSVTVSFWLLQLYFRAIKINQKPSRIIHLESFPTFWHKNFALVCERLLHVDAPNVDKVQLWVMPVPHICDKRWLPYHRSLDCVYWLAFLPTYSVTCSPSSMLQMINRWSLSALLTSQTLLPVFTGFELPSESSSNWWLLSTELFTGLRLSICLISWAMLLTCRLGDDFGRQLSTNLLFVRCVLVTVGERWFASAGPKLWNSLPDDITSASSLTLFRRKL